MIGVVGSGFLGILLFFFLCCTFFLVVLIFLRLVKGFFMGEMGLFEREEGFSFSRFLKRELSVGFGLIFKFLVIIIRRRRYLDLRF